MASNKSDDDASSCSESTNEVFFEMLGLPVIDYGVISSATEERPSTATQEKIEAELLPCSLDQEHNVVQPVVSFLQVPQRCSRYLHKPSTVAAFVIENLITLAECQEIIQLAEDLSAFGFHYVTEASHTDNDGKLAKDTYNVNVSTINYLICSPYSLQGITHKVLLREPNKHKLSVFEHETTLTKLWNKLEPVILPHISNFIEYTNSRAPLGLNPRLRVLRYDATDNDVFEPHFDATTRVNVKEHSMEMTSLLTVLIYLNDGGGKDFDGGETHYLDSLNANAEPTRVVPSMGSAVVFEHDLYHSSVPLKFGRKYVLRTDILFELGEESGVEKPRDRYSGETQQSYSKASTLLDLCEELVLCEQIKACLSEIGLIDLTLETLVAPGLAAVKQMLLGVIDESDATLIVNALVSHCLQH
jgi:hypothetical protein